MAHLPFTKMQGAGNDFIIVNNMDLGIDPARFPAIAKRVCTPRLSLGGDALMVADRPEEGGDLRMRFYNSDGTEGEMCGNGARCLARYAYENGLSGETMTIETVAGPVYGWRLTEREYKIKLNTPEVLELDHPVEVNGVTYACSYVELGDPGLPHAVVFLPGLKDKPLEEMHPLGAAIRSYSSFPKGANVNFYDIEPDGTLRLLTFERGVEGFTLACGTGTGSTACVLTLKGLVTAQPVCLEMMGGTLKAEVECSAQGKVTGLWLIGDTNIVAKGIITDEDLTL